MKVEVLNNADLKAVAPSVFARTPHSSRSQRYVHVPTIDVLEMLRGKGFLPVRAMESKVRKGREDRAGYVRHMIWLQRQQDMDRPVKQIGDVIPQIVMVNSHDGTSSFQLIAGMYRLVCENGLIVKMANDAGSISVHHSGKELMETVSEAAHQVSKLLPDIVRVAREWDKIQLTAAAQTRFARKALALRYAGNSPITPEQALASRREADEAPTLWRTYNVLEENLTKGGIVGATATGRQSTTRRLQSVNNRLHFERGLWNLAEEIAVA